MTLVECTPSLLHADAIFERYASDPDATCCAGKSSQSSCQPRPSPTSLMLTRSDVRSVTALAGDITVECVSPRARPQPRQINWDNLAREVRATLEAGIDEAERGEFANLTAEETEHYLQTGELPERVERWLASYDSRRGT